MAENVHPIENLGYSDPELDQKLTEIKTDGFQDKSSLYEAEQSGVLFVALEPHLTVFEPSTMTNRHSIETAAKPKLPERLQKRLDSNSKRKKAKTKEELENEQKLAEDRREKLKTEAKKRRIILKEKTDKIMEGFDFMERQSLLKRGVAIPNVEKASSSQINKTYEEVNKSINLLNSNLNKELKRTLAEANALIK